MSIRLSTVARNAAADAVVDLIDGGSGAGTLRIYSGAQPVDGDTEGAGTLLATVTFADPAFGDSILGTATAMPITEVVASGSGNAASFVVEDPNGTNIFNGTVTATGGGGDLQVATTTFSPGVAVDVTGFTYTQPGA